MIHYTLIRSQVGEIYVHAAIQVSLTVKEEVDLQPAAVPFVPTTSEALFVVFFHRDLSKRRTRIKKKKTPFHCRETISASRKLVEVSRRDLCNDFCNDFCFPVSHARDPLTASAVEFGSTSSGTERSSEKKNTRKKKKLIAAILNVIFVSPRH